MRRGIRRPKIEVPKGVTTHLVRRNKVPGGMLPSFKKPVRRFGHELVPAYCTDAA